MDWISFGKFLQSFCQHPSNGGVSGDSGRSGVIQNLFGSDGEETIFPVGCSHMQYQSFTGGFKVFVIK